MALVTGVSAGIGATYAAAKVPSPLAARAENALVSSPILPALLRLTLPNLAAMLVLALVAIFETVYVGILGTTPLAAIAMVFPLIMLMQMLSAGAMGGGVSSAISRASSSARRPASLSARSSWRSAPRSSACSVAPGRCSARRWSMPTSHSPAPS
jgi:hypothetical protein